MNLTGPVFMPVQCPSCGSVAQIKSTKTSHLMLRCDSCGVLIFANGPLSQAWLINLPKLGSN
jgi:phage FluMu protein Com